MQREGRARMKFAAAMLNVAGFGDERVRFSDALQTISECGFERVMLLSVRNSGPVLQRGVTPNGALVDLTRSDLDVVAGALQKAGQQAKAVFAAGMDPTSAEMMDESLEFLREVAAAAVELGCHYVGHSCGRAAAPGMSVAEKQDEIKRMAEMVDEVASVTPTVRFAVDVHYHGTVESVADCEYYIGQLASRNAGIGINTGHLTTCGQPGWELAANFPDRTPIIGWKDHFAGTEGERPAASFQLGTAETPFEEYIEVIKPQTTDRAHVITFEDVPADKKKEALLASRLFIEDLWDQT